MTRISIYRSDARTHLVRLAKIIHRILVPFDLRTQRHRRDRSETNRHSSNSFCPLISIKYIEPVVVRVAPKKWTSRREDASAVRLVERDSAEQSGRRFA